MPRPRKCRRIGRMPGAKMYLPVEVDAESGALRIQAGAGESGRKEVQFITLAVDEYETLRLIDKEGLSQEECGQEMQVARTTVQQIYNTARAKVAEALVEGLAIRIEGGDYEVCQGAENGCGCGHCRRHREKNECDCGHNHEEGHNCGCAHGEHTCGCSE
ncbi:MAG: DUF134 domain-containing protein [Firmicutes bacterium]|nr:DUF134 domain-containing protein [Bacillota bacterium]